jgi:BirA family biotin operon repressor/biotin-[acetyl-CoA-carboxylase] ligase
VILARLGLAPSTGWRLRIFDQLPSTSEFCRERALKGEPDYLAVMARRQTAGRGSRGRHWQSPPGNLALSLLLRPTERAREIGQWALLAGVALAEALEAKPGGPMTLKWPNDLLLNGAKLAGILLDAESDADSGISWLIIGIGVNLAHAPPVEDRSVAALDGSIAPEALAWRIMERVAEWRRVRLSDGFAPIRAAWLRHAQPLGTEMTVKLASATLNGRFAGLNGDGNLLLQTPDGRVQPVLAGEVWTPHKEAPPC